MNLRVPFLGFSIGLVVWTSCLAGPPSDRDSPGALGGQRHQEPPTSAMMFSIAEPSPIPTRVSGVVLEDLGLSIRQLPDVEVVLIRHDEIMFRTKTNHDGTFELSGNIPDGVYRLRASAPQLRESEMSLRVDRHAIDGLRPVKVYMAADEPE